MLQEKDFRPQSNLNKRSSLLTSRLAARLSLYSKNPDSGMFYSQGVTADRLAKERLQKLLESEEKKTKMVVERMEHIQKNIPVMLAELKRLEQTTEQEIAALLQKCGDLENQKTAKEEELTKMNQEMEKLKYFQGKFLKEHEKTIETLSSENRHLSKRQSDLENQLRLLEEQIQKNKELSAPVQPHPESQESVQMQTALTEISSETIPPPQAEIDTQESAPPEERKSFLKRCLDWWTEPVSTINFPNRP